VSLPHPIWLFLLVPLGLSLWLWRLPGRLLLALRALALVLVVLALCGMAVRLPSRAGTVVVVADRSLSMPPGSEAAQKEVIDLLRGAMGADDRLAVVSFGQAAAVERAPETGAFPGFVNEVGGNASDLAEALETALALIPRGAPGKILVLSDGRWTGRDPAAAAARAAARGVAIDFRPMHRPAANDLAIARLEAPSEVAPGESFLLTAWVHAPAAQVVSYRLRCGERVLAEGQQTMTAGLNRLTFRDRAGEPGNQGYTLEVRGPADDPVPENNRARVLVGVGGPRPILHVTGSKNSGLARLLERGGLKVKVSAPADCDWSLEGLSKFSAVLLENTPAEKVGTAGMETLAAWVREAGAGLVMTGGRNAYAPGGYYRSPLEPILPVSMELRQEHRKLALAIVVVLDRSGSMSMAVAGGRQKMDLANLGTAAVLDLLGPSDEFGVIAVDTEPHTIAALAPVTNKERVRNDVLRIQSMGGGIYIYVALEAAARMIEPAKAGTKHIILFADAADSEQPGRYEPLVQKCRDAGITISAIGLGTEKDKDAELLRDIARRGGGRVFFTDKPEELPRLFAQETFVVARNTFLDEPTPIRTTPGLAALTGRDFGPPPSIGGYNLNYLRDGATLATVTEDEYKAPVVAAWQAGSGRVLCFTGEADGKYAGEMARWGQAGDYFTSLVRWAAGRTGPLPGNMLVTQEVQGGINRVRLHLDPDRKGELFTGLPGLTTLRERPGQGPAAQKSALRWAGADTLEAEVPLHGGEVALATVEIPGHGPVALPPVCLPYSPEYKPVENDRGLRTLERLGRATGGVERVELARVWKDMPRQPRLIGLAPWLLMAALALLLVEVFERRTGLLSRQQRRLVWRRQRKPTTRPSFVPAPRAAARREATPAPAHDSVTHDSVKGKAPAPAPPQPEGTGMVEALRKARERTRGRTER
jgi:Mg-chelatase subunit ChlD